jgi:signal peptidase I
MKDETASTMKKIFSRENIEAVVIAVVLALFIRTFVIQAYKIPSGSMLETIQLGDHILVNKFIYGIKIPFIHKTLIHITNPKRGDIIVFIPPNDPDKDYIKRVIGIPGDVIEIKNKQLYRNGKLVKEPYVMHTDPNVYPRSFGPRDNFGPVTVPPGHLFMMGDNRDSSLDSRYWGFASLNMVEGKALIIYWSWDSQDFKVRWSRIGHLLN